jgi:hypothetical protein
MKNLTLVLLVITITSSYTVAQTTTPQVINASGNTYRQGDYVLEWSIGESSLINQMQSPNAAYFITNGFLQPIAPYTGPSDNNHFFSDEEIRILPNPTRGMIAIKFSTLQKGNMKLALYNALGIIVYTREFTSSGNGHLETINLTGYASGAYMLRIILNPEQGSVQKKGIYKIIKIS